MWFDYQKERYPGFNVLEKEWGFATYSYLTVKGERGVYIEDIYIVPDRREDGLASVLSEEIQAIAAAEGAKYLLGSVATNSSSPTDSIAVLLAHGMQFLESDKEIIYFYKGI